LPPENKRKLWEERLDAALGVAASAILFALMLITFADVVSRYLFNWPLRGAFEATELMLLVLIFAGLPLVSHADEHVTMDFIDRMLTPRATAALVRVVHALCAAVMFFLAWQVWIKATRIAGYGDTTDVLRVPVGPFVYFMALMIGLTGLVHVLRVFVPGNHLRISWPKR
jgi:TRAP-type C4-dicarboxylate transport system permease small subunit